MDDINFNEAARLRREVEKRGKIKYAEQSKIRLSNILTTKIKTTMIGALASVENHLGFLWEPDVNEDSVEKMKMRELFEKLREEILNNGNNQIRNTISELQQYNVEWLRYTINLPVRKETKEENDG